MLIKEIAGLDPEIAHLDAFQSPTVKDYFTGYLAFDWSIHSLKSRHVVLCEMV